jgi:hypothetical protein
MKLKHLPILTVIIINILISNNLRANIKNEIVVKVGNQIVTSQDIENEIKTILFLNNREINQLNIDNSKRVAIKSFVRRLIKKNEIERYNIKSFDKKDLSNQINGVAKSKQTDKNGLKNMFEINDISYEVFEEKYKIELLWRTLIFQIYKNQLDVNPVEIDNYMENQLRKKQQTKEYNISEIEISANNKNFDTDIKKINESIEKDGFIQTAKQFSISDTSINGGTLGWIAETSLSQTYIDELTKINIGEITGPIKNLESVIILKIDDIKITANQEVDIEKIKENIIQRKREDKLSLFSRSHFSNLENSILIVFK